MSSELANSAPGSVRPGRALANYAAWTAVALGLPLSLTAVARPANAETSLSVGSWLAETLPSVLAVSLPALGAAWLATGRSGVGAALLWIGGHRDEARAATAARALASAARASIGAGLVLALGSLIFASAVAGQTVAPSPAILGRGLSGGLFAPMFALLLGRCVFGACAADAALRSGERHGRTLRGWSDTSVALLLVLLPALLMLATLLDFRVAPL